MREYLFHYFLDATICLKIVLFHQKDRKAIIFELESELTYIVVFSFLLSAVVASSSTSNVFGFMTTP
jgi:hypothetical protein